MSVNRRLQGPPTTYTLCARLSLLTHVRRGCRCGACASGRRWRGLWGAPRGCKARCVTHTPATSDLCEHAQEEKTYSNAAYPNI